MISRTDAHVVLVAFPRIYHSAGAPPLALGIDDHIASVVLSTGLVATPPALQKFAWEGMDVHIALGLWFFDAFLFAAGFAY